MTQPKDDKGHAGHPSEKSPGVKEAETTQHDNKNAPAPPVAAPVKPQTPEQTQAEPGLGAGTEDTDAAGEVTTARQLLDSLIADGTPPKVLEDAEAWVSNNKDGSAEALYRHMEAHGCDGAEGRPTEGTLRKACKLVFGASSEPQALVSQVPGEEMVNLRTECENLRKSLKNSESQRLSVQKQLDLANEAKNTAVRKLQAASGKLSKKERTDLGLDD